MNWNTLFVQAPAPEWYRWLMVAIGLVGMISSTLFVVGFLTAPTRYRRFSLAALDQWILYAAGALASMLYTARWFFAPPSTWGGPGFASASILLLTLVDTAFIVRLRIWWNAGRSVR